MRADRGLNVKGMFLNLLLHMVLQHYVHLRGIDTWLLVLLVLPQHPSPILMQEHHGLESLSFLLRLTKSTLVIAKQTIFAATYVIFSLNL